ncbi:MAG: hypothetical protein ACOYKB_02160 [Succiniclasticum sp.]|jgi:hypothetical protein
MNWNQLRKKSCALLAWLGMAGLFGHPVYAGEVQPVPESYDDVAVEPVWSGPRLFFSDSPESVYEKGIVFRGVADGDTRLFLHHLNETKETLKIAVLLRPVGEGTYITWGLRGIGTPNKDYFKAARESQRRYFEDYARNRSYMNEIDYDRYRQEPRQKDMVPDYYNIYNNRDLAVTQLNPGEFVDGLSLAKNAHFVGTRVKPKELLTGMFDFRTRAPVEVLVLVMDPKDDAAAFAATARELPMDEHPLRGIYDHSDVTYFVKKPIELQPGQAAALTMGVSDDPQFLRGRDPVSGKETSDYGNYGVVYHVVYTLGDATKKNPVSVSLNPWGGSFSGAALAAGPTDATVLDIPPSHLVFSEQDKRETVQTFTEGNTTQEFLWSPPGASNLPLRLFWIREQQENTAANRTPGRMRALYEQWKAARNGTGETPSATGTTK